MAPRVSVIVPVHNAEQYLEQCLDSILSQTETDIELVCIDDGSTDSSLHLLKKYESADSRVVIIGTNNQGAGAARNLGLSVAKGTYLSFLDADDFFEPTMFKEVVDAMSRDDADIAVFGSWVFDTARDANRQAKWNLRPDLTPEHQPFSYRDMPEYIFNAFGNPTWNKIFKREFIQKKGIAFQEISRANDLLFTCRALVAAERIITIDKPYVHYRINSSTSLQATKDRDPLSFLKAFFTLEENLKQDSLYEYVEHSFLNHLLDGIVFNLDSVHTLEALTDLKAAIEQDVEPRYQLLQQPEDVLENKKQLKQYEFFFKNDMQQYLINRLGLMKEEREDLYWYSDWAEWKLWIVDQENAQLKNALEHRFISKLRQCGHTLVSSLLKAHDR